MGRDPIAGGDCRVLGMIFREFLKYRLDVGLHEVALLVNCSELALCLLVKPLRLCSCVMTV
jgi:hypothetical protein